MKIILAGFFGLYFFTLMPGVGWGDVAKYQLASKDLDLPLLAGFHPWYAVISGLWTKVCVWGSVAWKQNFLSCLLAVGALASFYQACRRLQVSEFACQCGTLILGLSHTFWSLAVWAESLILFAWFWVVSTGRVLLFLKTKNPQDLCWALFIYGLAMGNNLLQPFAGPAVLATVLVCVPESRNFRWWKRPLLWGFLGLVPWFLLMVWVGVSRGLPFSELLGLAFDQKYHPHLFWKQTPGVILQGLAPFPLMAIYQFGLFVLVPFMFRKILSSHKLFLVLLLAMMFLFCSTYLRQRALWLLIAAWVPMAFWITLSFQARERGGRGFSRWVVTLPLLTIFLYVMAPKVIEISGREWVSIAEMNPRDNVRVYFQPWKQNDDSGMRYIEDVDRRLKAGDLLIVDFTPGQTLEYAQQIEGYLQGVDLVHFTRPDLNDLIESRIKSSRVFIARDHPEYFDWIDPGRWSFKSIGYIFEVVKKS